jgi:hypothetical protein
VTGPGTARYCGNSAPARSRTMKSAYHSRQFASSRPVLTSCAMVGFSRRSRLDYRAVLIRRQRATSQRMISRPR